MREYKPKNNVQKKSYYTDRFWVAPSVPREEVAGDDQFAKDLAELKNYIEIKEAYIELKSMVVIVEHEAIHEALRVLKERLKYDILTEMSAIDYIAQRGGFEMFYQMLSISKVKRIRLKALVPEGAVVESAEPLFRSADWQERECYDMFGIRFNNHPNLKRILMPDDWHDHPLKKTYPLHGDDAAQWYEVDKIFGKENRDVVGPENRDPARIDRYNTKEFARLGHEVEYGVDITKAEPETDIRYYEDKRPFLLPDYTPEKSKELKERK